MTLLTTEVVPAPAARIIFAADRRISSALGHRLSERPKIFEVPGRNAGIGYFGLAVVRRSAADRERMDRWLTECLSRHSTASSLRQLAEFIRDDLNRDVPAKDRSQYVSGLHLAGFEGGVPEFWYIRNVGDDGSTLFGHYEIREDFQARDGLRSVGPVIYRNGDIRAHVTAWERLDEAFGGLLSAPDFRLSASPIGHARWVRFKLQTIASFYEQFARSSIIGRPIDTLLITTSGVTRVVGRGAQSAPRRRQQRASARSAHAGKRR